MSFAHQAAAAALHQGSANEIDRLKLELETRSTTAEYWRNVAADRQAEIDRLTVRVLALQKALGQAEAREDNHAAASLTSYERNQVAMFLALPRADRQSIVDRYTRDPKVSGSLISVMKFLITA